MRTNGFDFSSATQAMEEEINKIELLADDEAKKALQQAATVYKTAVRSSASGSERFKRIGSGARQKIKKSKQTGCYYLVVKGSKKYASLWHLANNGYLAWGKINIPGNHFVDQAVKASEGTIDSIIDQAVNNISRG